MADPNDNDQLDGLLRRRSGFSIFDFWKKPGWRLGTGAENKGPYWYVAAGIGFALALWAVWPDLTGGASLTRIITVFIVVAGVAFYFLIRFQQTLFWAAIISVGGAVLVFALQIRQWLSDDVWSNWQVNDIPIFAELADTETSAFAAWMGNQPAILTLIAIAIGLGFVLAALRRFRPSSN